MWIAFFAYLSHFEPIYQFIYLSGLLRQPSDPSFLLAWAARYVLLVEMSSWSFHCHHSSIVILLSPCHRRHAIYPDPVAKVVESLGPIGMGSWSLHCRHSSFVIRHSSCCRRYKVVMHSLSHVHSVAVISTSWSNSRHALVVTLSTRTQWSK